MATPVVTDISPDQAVSGDVVTIHGSGFSEVASENYVIFGDVACALSTSTSTTIECTLGNGFAGFRHLYLHVLHSGVAEVRGRLGITYSLTVNSISPSQGSSAGGTVATIIGSGFYSAQSSSDGPASELEREGVYSDATTISECPGGWQNEVLLGGAPCTVTDSTSTSLTVIVPPEDSGTYSGDLQVSVVCPDRLNISQSTTLSNAYTYDASLTPSITSISPRSGSIQGGDVVEISGSGFSSSNSENQVMVKYKLAFSKLFILHSSSLVAQNV